MACLPAVPDNNGILTPPLPGPPPGVTSSTIPQGGGQSPDQPQMGGPKEGWIGGRWARRVVKAITKASKNFDK